MVMVTLRKVPSATWCWWSGHKKLSSSAPSSELPFFLHIMNKLTTTTWVHSTCSTEKDISIGSIHNTISLYKTTELISSQRNFQDWLVECLSCVTTAFEGYTQQSENKNYNLCMNNEHSLLATVWEWWIQAGRKQFTRGKKWCSCRRHILLLLFVTFTKFQYTISLKTHIFLLLGYHTP